MNQVTTEVKSNKIDGFLSEAEKTNLDILNALNLTAIVSITDSKGVIIHANEKFCEVSKYKKEELIGSNHRIVNSGYHPDYFFKELWRTISQGNIWTGEVRNKAKDGTFYWVYTTIVPVLNEKNIPAHYISIRMEITKSKHFEEERNKALLEIKKLSVEQKIRDEVVTLLTHDLRTPMSAARMAAELVLREMSSKSSLRGLPQKIVEYIDRTDKMIVDFLDNQKNRLSRSFLTDKAECDAVPVVQEALSELKLIYGERFSFTTAGYLRGFWSASGIRRIVENLCVNAVKYGHENRPISVALIGTSMDMELSVSNFGKKLNGSELNEIFDYLHRSDEAIESNQKGWGIGLALVKKVAEAHQATVSAESNEGFTVFRVKFPKLPQ